MALASFLAAGIPGMVRPPAPAPISPERMAAMADGASRSIASGAVPAPQPVGMAGRLFGSRATINPNARFGDGYDPATGTMSLSGGDTGSDVPGSIAPAPRDIQVGDFAAPRQVKPNFFGQGGMGRYLVGYLGDALRGNNAFAQSVNQQREWDRADALYRQKLEDERNQPRFFSGNADQLVYDPATKQTQVIYDAPSLMEQYAGALGLQPGDAGYDGAIKDYVLRSQGPTAYGNRVNFEEARQDNRLEMEGARQGNRVALEGVRQGNRLTLKQTPGASQARPDSPSSVFGALLAKQARGETLTPAEQTTLAQYNRRPRRGGGGSGGGGAPAATSAPSSAPTATDPKTGRKVQWNGSAWVPVG